MRILRETFLQGAFIVASVWSQGGSSTTEMILIFMKGFEPQTNIRTFYSYKFLFSVWS